MDMICLTRLIVCSCLRPCECGRFLLAGINAGQNDGLNVIYSGTCAAALEASIHDIPSIAFSLEYNFATGGSPNTRSLLPNP